MQPSATLSAYAPLASSLASRPVSGLVSSPVPCPMSGPSAADARRPELARLRRRIDDAFDAFAAWPDPSQQAEFARRIHAALAAASAARPWLTDAERAGDPQRYRRHLLAADPLGRYAIVSLVWQPGQWSPVHGHQTWCGYTVLDGTLTETLYDWDASAGLAIEKRSHPRAPGAVSFVRAGHGIHRLGHGGQGDHGDNLYARPAVSLHVYGVPGERIATDVNDVVRVAETAHA
ncbi:cysteine dioxygenase family protein [Burkholderia guangdongensis]|uniref:cysteine dioxygenase family protein n=1 Tax=Burkholderia guangdongensis TaxID=1792500 RepID=UPI001FE5599E|nr:cysteine dioxygenase family protein [Burkholderia guangdongensis]